MRSTLLWAGQKTSATHLADLRSVLSYLELGRWLHDEHVSRQPVRVRDDLAVFALALDRITGTQPLYLEFGVFRGRSMRWWSAHLMSEHASLVGFDSFEGLPEAWRPGFEAGRFKTGEPPLIDDPRVSFQVGWFDATLPTFEVPSHDQLVINIDSDLYSSAATVLRWAEPLLRPGTLIYFDEFPDRDHEMKAFSELRERSPLTFTPIAIAQGGLHWLFEVG